jgi:two-component system sensor histidine kinase/response regulator
VIKRQLRDWKLNAKMMTRGQQALLSLVEHAANAQFDLIIMNRHMPDIDSLAFVKTIRKHQALDPLKIVFMTLISNQNDKSNCAQIGINGHFPKPVTTLDLHHALNILVDVPSVQPSSDLVVQEKSLEPVTDMSWMKKVKLLLVEDNRVNQMVAMGVLKKIGIEQCFIAQNGKVALEKLKLTDDSDPFTFIFMDCQMPEMDGYQATRLIREGAAGERYKNIPIVAMTANAMLGDKEKCLSAGMDDYLVKPINKSSILDTLRIFLREGE